MARPQNSGPLWSGTRTRNGRRRRTSSGATPAPRQLIRAPWYSGGAPATWARCPRNIGGRRALWRISKRKHESAWPAARYVFCTAVSAPEDLPERCFSPLMPMMRLRLFMFVERATWAFGVGGLVVWGTYHQWAAAAARLDVARFAAHQDGTPRAGTPDQSLWSPERIAAWRRPSRTAAASRSTSSPAAPAAAPGGAPAAKKLPKTGSRRRRPGPCPRGARASATLRHQRQPDLGMTPPKEVQCSQN